MINEKGNINPLETLLTATIFPLRGSMTRMVLSLQAVQMRLPLRFQQTLYMTSGCISSRVISGSPVPTFQMMIWLSQPANRAKWSWGYSVLVFSGCWETGKIAADWKPHQTAQMLCGWMDCIRDLSGKIFYFGGSALLKVHQNRWASVSGITLINKTRPPIKLFSCPANCFFFFFLII